MSKFKIKIFIFQTQESMALASFYSGIRSPILKVTSIQICRIQTCSVKAYTSL